MITTRICIVLSCWSLFALSLIAQEELTFETDFSKPDTFERWFSTQPEQWKVTDQSLHLTHTAKKYAPPFRSPFSIILLKDHVYGDFTITAKVKTLQTSRGHRDMCIFWGWQDPANYYYVHLGEKKDPKSSQVFIVKDAPRTAITKTSGEGIPWKDDTWHHVKLVRKVATGLIQVYFDNMTTPVMTATDKSLQWGLIGLGSFDDFGMWDDVRINGELMSDKKPTLPIQNREGETVGK